MPFKEEQFYTAEVGKLKITFWLNIQGVKASLVLHEIIWKGNKKNPLNDTFLFCFYFLWKKKEYLVSFECL